MAWYSTGTVAVTNGSTAVTGTGTGWFGALQDGWGFVGPDGRVYEIDTVVSATSITLAQAYQGTTASGQAYSAFPTNAIEIDLAAAIQQLITDFQSVVTGAGAGKFDAGSVAAPGVAFEVDPDTGLRRVSANKVALVAGGADQLALTGGVATGAAVQASPSDTTVGRLLTTGAFGLGGTGAQVITDFNAADRSGYYAIADLSAASNKPAGWNSGPASVHVTGSFNANNMTQYAVSLNGGGKVAIRSYRSSNWSGWSEVYTANSVLGTVSQSGGVPTGAVIESGSNANGEYTRWADGTQICTNGNAAITTAPAAFTGTITKVDGDKLWIGRWF
ncbi:pyocin knob domain-containing protein [Sedimentitalea sp. JM2-8]|uniref:Pyocin knob domain-containing protein n=1 Tax=Sedimentitalea xiamensis TaxID=3050037 RepID=A0ABT7FCE2_9RHOB|nr:pyocin knob domain-containing protein [Sedimentitalea xiamensis]MDK3072777.1 pyocin knob domain-containing protein [Sedimentitalea xiamensis]